MKRYYISLGDFSTREDAQAFANLLIKNYAEGWIPVSLKLPDVSGWYMVALNPINYADYADYKELNSWRSAFGCQVTWFHNEKFWEESTEITDRVTHWGYCPKVPMY